MKKALITASVLIGAFLFQPSIAQVLNDDGTLGEHNPTACPLGGNYSPVLGFCFVSATVHEQYELRIRDDAVGVGETMDEAKTEFSESFGEYIKSLFPIRQPWRPDGTRQCTFTESNPRFQLIWTGVTGQPPVNDQVFNYNLRTTITAEGWECPFVSGCKGDCTRTSSSNVAKAKFVSGPQCPPESTNPNFYVFSSGPYVTEESYPICYYLSSTPDNDDDCPPDTVGGCEPNEPEPDCVIAGNGMEVCRHDPNEKCTATEVNGETVYSACEAGCGFVNDQFLCTTEPDSDGEIPDLSKCFKVGNSWACPSDPTPPDDNIDDPEKLLPDMTKRDFKDVNIGIETRLNSTNALLGEVASTNELTAKGIQDLNAKALAGNRKLDDIIENTGKTASNLEGEALTLDTNYQDTFRSAFGITGDESLDDLTKAEITLDEFRSDFQWGATSSACPAPRPINILGRTFHMEWQPFCTAFTVLGYFILAAAYFLSIRIAFGGRL